jgi:hypothetical protein
MPVRLLTLELREENGIQEMYVGAVSNVYPFPHGLSFDTLDGVEHVYPWLSVFSYRLENARIIDPTPLTMA